MLVGLHWPQKTEEHTNATAQLKAMREKLAAEVDQCLFLKRDGHFLKYAELPIPVHSGWAHGLLDAVLHGSMHMVGVAHGETSLTGRTLVEC